MLDRHELHLMIVSFGQVMASIKNGTAIPVLRMLKLNICLAPLAQHHNHFHNGAFHDRA
jgi:hypothetical protein